MFDIEELLEISIIREATICFDILLKKIQVTPKVGIEQLFRLHYSPLCKAIYPILRDKATTEDVVQDIFVKIWQDKDQLTTKRIAYPYLRKMAVNKAIDYLRKKLRKTTAIQGFSKKSIEQENPENQILLKELRAKVEKGIAILPPKRRAIFMMSRQQGLTYKEIAAKLDISVKTVENQMGKALRVLRGKLRGYLSMFF